MTLEAFARSPTARGSVLRRELLLAQAAELLPWPKSGKCPLSTRRMADVQMSASLSPPGRIERNGTVMCILQLP